MQPQLKYHGHRTKCVARCVCLPPELRCFPIIQRHMRVSERLSRGSHSNALADPDILTKRGGADGNVSAPSYFIANAHNELYTRFMREKATCWQKFWVQWGATPPCSLGIEHVIFNREPNAAATKWPSHAWTNYNKATLYEARITYIFALVDLTVCFISSNASSVSWLFCISDRFCSSSSEKMSRSCWGSVKNSLGSCMNRQQRWSHEGLSVCLNQRGPVPSHHSSLFVPTLSPAFPSPSFQSYHVLRWPFVTYPTFLGAPLFCQFSHRIWAQDCAAPCLSYYTRLVYSPCPPHQIYIFNLISHTIQTQYSFWKGSLRSLARHGTPQTHDHISEGSTPS